MTDGPCSDPRDPISDEAFAHLLQASIRRMDRREALRLLGAGAASLAFGPWLAGRSGAEPYGGGAGPGKRPTKLTEEYGIEVPFVGAGMAFVSTPELVAAVSNAGGLGLLGAAPEPPLRVREMIRTTNKLTSNPFGVDFIHASGGPTGTIPFTTDAHIDVCVEEDVDLVVFFWTTPPASWVKRLHDAETRVWMQVGSVVEAVEAAEVGVDAIIAQGREAGGHGRSSEPLHALLPEVIRAVSPLPVLAAGGIADASDATAALVAGAEGICVGTRLVASVEAFAHDEYKARIVAASANDTVRTTLFGPEWPHQLMRCLRNRVVDEWAGREDEVPFPPPPPPVIGVTNLFGVPYAMPKFSAVLPTPDASGDFDEMAFTAGESVQRIHDIKPAASIVNEMMRGSSGARPDGGARS